MLVFLVTTVDYGQSLRQMPRQSLVSRCAAPPKTARTSIQMSVQRFLVAALLVSVGAISACPEEPPQLPVADVPSQDVPNDVATIDDGQTSEVEAGPVVGQLDDILRLNHIQSLGTHNSYHLRGDPVVDPSHEYDHLPLAAQLDLGVRAFELDIHKPEALVGADDFAVYHIGFLDPKTTCLSLKACLQEIVSWSDAHPMHVPIAVWIEPKGSAGGGPILDLPRLDAVIAAVVSSSKIITPALVRGKNAHLREALAERGWPTLGDSRGKLLFALLDTGDPRDIYTSQLTEVHTRTAFVGAKTSEFGEPWAGVAKINNPASSDISAAHAAGLLVASNLCLAGEADDSECAAGTDAASIQGSHWLKTDFPQSEGNPYSFSIPPRCNPATAPPQCEDAAIE